LRETSRALTKARRELDVLKSNVKLDSRLLMAKAEEIKGLERGEEFLKALLTELF
jgi:hypothetical protein